jgi:hypothetical protein
MRELMHNFLFPLGKLPNEDYPYQALEAVAWDVF